MAGGDCQCFYALGLPENLILGLRSFSLASMDGNRRGRPFVCHKELICPRRGRSGQEVRRDNTAASPASLGVYILCSAGCKMPHHNGRVYTVCQIHNATPGPLTFVKSRDLFGRIGQIPQEISSGRRGLFLHHGDIATHWFESRSAGAVVYRCEDPTGLVCDWMMSWFNVGYYLPETPTCVHTEIMERDHYDVLDLERIVEQNFGRIEGLGRLVDPWLISVEGGEIIFEELGGLQSVYARELRSVHSRGGCGAIVTGYPGKVHGEVVHTNVLI